MMVGEGVSNDNVPQVRKSMGPSKHNDSNDEDEEDEDG